MLFAATLVGFSAVIAFLKDVPDADGDRAHRIRTVALTLGPAGTLLLGRFLLTLWYIVTALAVLMGGVAGLQPVVFVIGHALAAIALWVRGLHLDTSDRHAITRYYLFIWVLFYLEFIIFLVAGLTSDS